MNEQPLTAEEALRQIIALCDLTIDEMREQYGSEQRVLIAVIPSIAERATLDAARADVPDLVCSLCLFVGDSENPLPVTVLNGNLTCEPHNGYFQGGDHVQAIIAWKRKNPEAPK